MLYANVVILTESSTVQYYCIFYHTVFIFLNLLDRYRFLADWYSDTNNHQRQYTMIVVRTVLF